jgi:hypothetical protein
LRGRRRRNGLKLSQFGLPLLYLGPNFINSLTQADQFGLGERSCLVHSQHLGTQSANRLGLFGLKITHLLLDLVDLSVAIGVRHTLAESADSRLDLPPLIYLRYYLTGTLYQLVQQVAH